MSFSRVKKPLQKSLPYPSPSTFLLMSWVHWHEGEKKLLELIYCSSGVEWFLLLGTPKPFPPSPLIVLVLSLVLHPSLWFREQDPFLQDLCRKILFLPKFPELASVACWIQRRTSILLHKVKDVRAVRNLINHLAQLPHFIAEETEAPEFEDFTKVHVTELVGDRTLNKTSFPLPMVVQSALNFNPFLV